MILHDKTNSVEEPMRPLRQISIKFYALHGRLFFSVISSNFINIICGSWLGLNDDDTFATDLV